MLYLKAIQSVVEKSLWTGWLQKEKPISVLIVANPESFKTELLKKYRMNDGVVYMTDVTAYGLTKSIIPMAEMGKKVNHLIIPDLLNPLSKQLTTARAFIQFMNAIIEEGAVQVQTYAMQFKQEIQCGLITAITPSALARRRKYWNDIGFLSRLVPLSYSYETGISEDILKSIIKSDYQNEEDTITIQFPKEKMPVEDSPELYEQFLVYTHKFSEANKTYGFRYQKQLQVLAKANALSEKRYKVEQRDADWVKSVAEYINLEYNVIRGD